MRRAERRNRAQSARSAPARADLRRRSCAALRNGEFVDASRRMLDVRNATTAIALLLLLTTACSRQSSPAAEKPEVFWRPLGSWSGRGNTQTPSFTSDSGSLRVRWRTRNDATGGPGGPDGTETFRLTAQSAISGRPIAVAVDARGAGSGVAYVNDDPHVFYMLVESANLDWSFSVEEAFAGTPISGSSSAPAGKD